MVYPLKQDEAVNQEDKLNQFIAELYIATSKVELA